MITNDEFLSSYEFMCGIADQTISFPFSPMSVYTHVSSLGLLATLVGYIIYERRSIEKSLYHVPSFFSFSAPCLWRVSLFFSVFWYSSSLQRYYSVVLWIVVAATLLAVFFFTWTSSSLFFFFSWATLLVNHNTYDIYFDYIIRWLLPGFHIPVHV